MSANWGNNIELSIFGESHGPAIGIVIGGLPAGMKLDMDETTCARTKSDVYTTKGKR